jgi:CTP synthase (UTP-ammonia lyase)
MGATRIGAIGDYDASITAHRGIPRALEIASGRAGIRLEIVWLGTEVMERRRPELPSFSGFWCAPGSPYASLEGALLAVRHARETGRPFLGTCAGFQHALLEYARNVLGLGEAGHVETDPHAGLPLIAPLSCALVEEADTILFEQGSRLARIYGALRTREEYHCRYGLNPRYESLLGGQAIKISGRDTAGEVRAFELANHPFFIATLFQPERSGLRGEPHPLVEAFVAAAAAAGD